MTAPASPAAVGTNESSWEPCRELRLRQHRADRTRDPCRPRGGQQRTAPAYGSDDLTAGLRTGLQRVFERPCHFALLATGSAANGIALSLASPPYGQVLCHEASHIILEEGGAPEFYTGGAKLAGIPGAQGKLTVEGLEAAIDAHPPLPPHVMPRTVLSLTQATELGTVYTREEIMTLTAWARSQGLKVHMDGARFANAIIGSGASAAELSWKSGIDLLSFGATKNGALAAELLLVFDDALAEGLALQKARGPSLVQAALSGRSNAAYLLMTSFGFALRPTRTRRRSA